MIDTKLVLFEGPPGSGKSTTAQILTSEISNAGKSSQCFLEWSPDHPISIGDDLHLGQVIASAIVREEALLLQWQQFAAARQIGELVTVMESRFWQTSVMLMYAAGHPIQRILDHNQQVMDIIDGLKPVLIYFAIDDIGAFTAQTIRIKNSEWQRMGNPGSWDQHIYEAFESQKWFMDRHLTGLTGLCAFLEEWALVTQMLYDRVKFPKTIVRNPHQDWSSTMQQIRDFIDLRPA